MQGSKMSRRDWFRLRPGRTDSEAATNGGDCAMGNAAAGMSPIAQPVNHDGMDLSALPPMREAVLSADQVHQLFTDIEALGSEILLVQRSARSRRATASKAETSQQLRTAQDSLLSGDVPRVQIRYRWQETAWIDTLEHRTDGVRLVRIAHVASK